MKRKLCLIVGLLSILAINAPSYACTSIYIVQDSLIFYGKNQDFGEWRTRIGFTPPKDGRLGRAYWGGLGVFPTGGINSEGLFFEYHQGEYCKKMDTHSKIVFNGDLVDKIMSECKCIQDVVDTLKKYSHPFLFTQNIAFGDKLGNSIILEGDTIFYRKGHYQICTSFYQSKHDMSTFNFWKYNNAEKEIKADSCISINTIRDALNAAHEIFTQYSIIYDFKKELIYVYLYHDYNNVKIFNAKEELQRSEHFYYLPDFFPNNKNYIDTYVKRQTPQNSWFIRIFLGVFVIFIIASLVIIFTVKLPINEGLFSKRISILTKLIVGTVSLLSLIYLSRFLRDPESLQIGLFHPINQCYSKMSCMVLHIPKLLSLLDILLIILSFLHWKKHIYRLFTRIFLSIYTTLLVILILLLWYWGFIFIH